MSEGKETIRVQMETICTRCAEKAQKVEAVIEERTYGDRFGAFIIGRIYHHLHQDGTRKECREPVPEWLFTLASIEEVDKYRRVVASLLAKAKGNTQILKFLM